MLAVPLDAGTGVGTTPPMVAETVRFSDAAGAVLAEVAVSEMDG